MEEGGKREFKVREAGVSDPPVPLHLLSRVQYTDQLAHSQVRRFFHKQVVCWSVLQ